MPVRPARAACSLLPVAMAGLVGMMPLLAYAEDRDPAEIGHAIWFVSTFSIFFLGSMALAVWLLVVRLRSGATPPTIAPRYPSLEGVWSREPASSAPPTPVVESEKPQP